MSDEASKSSHADEGPVQQPVGRPVPERAEVGDVVTTYVRETQPQTLRLTLDTQESVDHFNGLSDRWRSGWVLEKRQAAVRVNGIARTIFHDEGAYAQCFYCRRYSVNPRTLSDRPPTCDCGSKHGWSGSFKAPGPDATWSGKTPNVRAEPPP